jgi:hypothetical protein
VEIRKDSTSFQLAEDTLEKLQRNTPTHILGVGFIYKFFDRGS